MFSRILLISAGLFLTFDHASAQDTGSKTAAQPKVSPASVLAVSERAADWQLAHPSKWPSTSWHQAAFYTGVMALAEISSSPRFEEAMKKVGESTLWAPGWRIYHADDHCVGQMYAELYLKYKDPLMIEKIKERFDYILSHPADKKDLAFVGKGKNDRWSWCDSLFMGPPTWLRLWLATGEQQYLDYMVREWWLSSDYLYDKDEHLYYRDSTIFDQREANGKKVFWSRGNGWVLAALARIIPFLPKDHPSRDRFIQQYREIATRVAELQQPDGLWRASMLDPGAYPMKETSGSGFFCFGLAWGINYGLLDRAKFEPGVLKTWTAMVECVNPDGKLTHVQPVGFTPKSFDPQATEVYGVGAFLLAGSEVYRLVGGTVPAAK
jgi:unsaturated rhamnogalacturonyl hydrolase